MAGQATLDLSSLTKYTDQLGFGLAKMTILEGVTNSVIRVEKDILYAKQLNNLTTSVKFQSRANCAPNSSGLTTFNKPVLTICPIIVRNEWCLDNLLEYWTGFEMDANGLNPEGLAFGDIIFGDITSNISQTLDKVEWQGSTQSTDQNLKQCTGFIQLLTGSSYSATCTVLSATSASMSAGTVASAGIYKNVQLMVDQMSADLANADVSIWMSPTNFNKYIQHILNLNWYNTDANIVDNQVYRHPGAYNVMIRSTVGLAGVNTMVLAENKNLVFGTYAMENFMNINSHYDKTDRKLYSDCVFNMGVQCLYASQVVVSISPT